MRDIKFRYFFKVYERDGIGINVMHLNLKEIEKRIFSYKDEDLIGAMQYTGLKDKNGVEIYEGDVLTNIHIHGVDDEDYGVVYFDGGCFIVNTNFMSLCLIEDHNDLEVIGNIHQNKELLK